MSTLNKISLDGNVYNISNFHYIENNSASNPFIITEHEPGIYVVNGSSAGVVPGVLYSKYIDSEDYNIKEDYFCGFLCLTDTSIDETYKRKILVIYLMPVKLLLTLVILNQHLLERL